MAAKYVDLGQFGTNIPIEKQLMSNLAENNGLEAIDVSRDGLMLHGDAVEIALFLKCYPNPPHAIDIGDLEDDF